MTEIWIFRHLVDVLDVQGKGVVAHGGQVPDLLFQGIHRQHGAPGQILKKTQTEEIRVLLDGLTGANHPLGKGQAAEKFPLMLIFDENTVLQADPQAVFTLLRSDGCAADGGFHTDLGQNFLSALRQFGIQPGKIKGKHTRTSLLISPYYYREKGKAIYFFSFSMDKKTKKHCNPGALTA